MSELSPQDKFEYVGVGRRAGAVIIDGIIWFIGFGYVIALFTSNPTGIDFGVAPLYPPITPVEEGSNVTGGPAILWFLLGFAYYVVLEATVGATVGKLFLGMRVTKTDGAPVGWGASFIRNLLRVVDGIAFYLVASILVWNSPERQRLGDRLASTVVVRR